MEFKKNLDVSHVDHKEVRITQEFLVCSQCVADSLSCQIYDTSYMAHLLLLSLKTYHPCQFKATTRVCEAHLHQSTSVVSLKQFHHKPMGMYGGGLLKLALGKE